MVLSVSEASFFPLAVQLQRSPPGGVVPVPAAAAGRGGGHEPRQGVPAGIAGRNALPAAWPFSVENSRRSYIQQLHCRKVVI